MSFLELAGIEMLDTLPHDFGPLSCTLTGRPDTFSGLRVSDEDKQGLMLANDPLWVLEIVI